MYGLYTGRFYNFPDPNMNGCLYYNFKYFYVLPSHVHVQAHISPCWRFRQISGYLHSVLFGCQSRLTCL